jgi:spore germination protein GerM
VTLYFLTDNGRVALGVRRDVPRDGPPAQGATTRGALKALLAGPTDSEREGGLTSAIPARTELLSVTFRDDAGAGTVIDLSDSQA